LPQLPQQLHNSLLPVADGRDRYCVKRTARPRVLHREQTRADVQTFFKSLFSKVCTSLQGLRLGNFLQTFSVEQLLSCTLFVYFFAHFLQQMIQVLQTSCTLILCLQTFAGHMHTFCREHDSILQTSCTPILDLMQT
jgi:hypothetical protein